MNDLKRLRQLKMLTQRELAEQVGVVLQAVQHWEAGTRRPRPAQQRQLCIALGVTAEELFAALDAAVETAKVAA